MKAFTAKDGLLYCNGVQLDVEQADAAAREFGYQFAEQFVRHIQAGLMPNKEMKFQVQELRPEVLAFALLMEEHLRQKDADKGSSWKGASGKDLIVHARSKMIRLEAATASVQRALVTKQAVDLGNYCMMLSDIAGGLDMAAEPVSEEPMVIPAFLRMYRDE